MTTTKTDVWPNKKGELVPYIDVFVKDTPTGSNIRFWSVAMVEAVKEQWPAIQKWAQEQTLAKQQIIPKVQVPKPAVADKLSPEQTKILEAILAQLKR